MRRANDEEETVSSLFNMRANLGNTGGPNPYVVSTATPLKPREMNRGTFWLYNCVQSDNCTLKVIT